MIILVCLRWPPAAILHFWKLKVSLLDRPHHKPEIVSISQPNVEVMAILEYLRWPSAAILDFRKLKILPLDRLSLTTP